jgi:hypothetical protein
MKISKALKQKNRIAGKLSKLQSLLARENSRRNDKVYTADREDLLNQINATRSSLIAIKAAITVASAGIATQLATLAEIKSEITYYESLPTKEGVETVNIGYSKETKDYTWESYITQAHVDKKTSYLQTQADALQDSIDEYNATTDVAYTE